MGKIGLPLAVHLASNGAECIGLDNDANVVAQIEAGQVPFPGEMDLEKRMRDSLLNGQFRVTTSYEFAVSKASTIVILVPLVVDDFGNPDFTNIDSAIGEMARHLSKGSLVVLETTLPVGTTSGRFAEIIRRESGFEVGVDVFLAFSPERVSSGRVFQDLARYPKIVGGVNEESGSRAVEFYTKWLTFSDRSDLPRGNGVWNVGNSQTAEFCKLIETTYRDVNIALANQFASFAESCGVDFREAQLAANSQPFSHVHSPGIAVGGHCIPVYPQFLLWADPNLTLVQQARLVNKSMAEHAVLRIRQEVGSLDALEVLILGAAYRGNVKEMAFSGVFELADSLRQMGAKPLVHDSLFSDEELMKAGLTAWNGSTPIRIAILQAEHDEYSNWTPADIPGVTLLFDGRRALSAEKWKRVRYMAPGLP
jgi:nucleotide sugar dehydrogenase